MTTAGERLEAALLGKSLTEISLVDYTWRFAFGDSVITTESYWRVLTADRLAVSSSDHDQHFGLPQPLDAARKAREFLSSPVSEVRLEPVSSDLKIAFGASWLEFLNTSCGYEGWHANLNTPQDEAEFIALGGGEVQELPLVERS